MTCLLQMAVCKLFVIAPYFDLGHLTGTSTALRLPPFPTDHHCFLTHGSLLVDQLLLVFVNA